MFVGFSKPKKPSFISDLIMSVMKAEYSHTFISFYVEDAQQMLVVQANRHGVACMSYSEFMEHNEVVYMFSSSDKEVNKSALSFCFNQLGKPYSFWNILAIYLKITLKDGERRFICSELVAKAIGVKSKTIDNITPKEIHDFLQHDSIFVETDKNKTLP